MKQENVKARWINSLGQQVREGKQIAAIGVWKSRSTERRVTVQDKNVEGNGYKTSQSYYDDDDYDQHHYYYNNFKNY